jgi:hypothetical protein
LSGNVALTGDSAIEFKGGQINTIATSATLSLLGNDAFLEDSTAPGSNSALTGLASISAGATFALDDRASVTTGALVNDGSIQIDNNSGDDGGSTLSIGGALTNTGTLQIGRSLALSSSAVSVTAKSFVNSGTVGLGTAGLGGSLAALNVSGAITNNGSIGIVSDTFSSTRAFRLGRPSTEAHTSTTSATRSSSSRRSPSPPR